MRILLLSTSLLALAAAEATPRLNDLLLTPLGVVPYDTVVLRDQGPVVGEILKVQPGESVRYQPQGQQSIITYDWSEIDHLKYRMSAADAVRERGRQCLEAWQYPKLHTSIEAELVRLARWGLEQDEPDAVRAVLAPAFALCTDSAALRDEYVRALQTSADPAATDELQRIVEVSLNRWPTWSEGYSIRARLLQYRADTATYAQALDAWLERQPTQADANRMRAELAETQQDWRLAASCWQRLFRFHGHDDAALAAARLKLWQGDHEAANKLIGEATAVAGRPEAQVIRGVAELQGGQIAEGGTRLLAATSAKLHPQLQLLRDYGLAWTRFQQGKHEAALELWLSIDHPAARYAVARASRAQVQDASVLTDPVLGPLARELNTCLQLEQEDFDRARQTLSSGSMTRPLALARIAAAQASLYHPDQLQALGQTSNRDAILWQAYGLILQGQRQQAEQALAALPADDGMAALYRVYCANARDDHDQAVAQFRIAAKQDDAPRGHLDRMSTFFFQTQGDTQLVEEFHWPVGERLPVGWHHHARGTGIQIQADGEHLVFTGTQTASTTPVSRVWRELPLATIREVALQLSFTGTGYAGLELRDASGQYGLAVAQRNGQRLAWRRRQAGRWLDWQIHPGLLPNTLRLWIDPERPGAEQVRLLTTRDGIPLTSLLDLPGQIVAIGVFVEAEPGSKLQCRVDRLSIQLKAEDE
jgi:hypothetical protein